MEGIVRLVQARARVELTSKATVDHVNEVILLIKFSQTEQQVNEGECSEDGTARQWKYQQLVNWKSSCALGKTIFDPDELRDMLKRAGITTGPTELILVLNGQGILYGYEYLME